MELRELFNAMPFARHLGIEVTAVGDGTARGHLELGDEHASAPGRTVAHGGVPYALADTVGGAAVMSRARRPTPTVDMRIDYLAPADGNRIEAAGELVRYGDSVAVAEVEVVDGADVQVARARGVYKTGGGDGETAWGNADDVLG
jgi:uncharacterized protein (TIGR00369 family)